MSALYDRLGDVTAALARDLAGFTAGLAETRGSFAGTALFVIGLHPGSARMSRRFAWPALVFNPHVQFDRLRETGKYERMQAVIRERERALQGDINLALCDFGVQSEARQYSGRLVEAGWRPPFCPHRGPRT